MDTSRIWISFYNLKFVSKAMWKKKYLSKQIIGGLINNAINARELTKSTDLLSIKTFVIIGKNFSNRM